ncbi:MAG: hypothetical protein IJJ85_09040 [Clostridia bacterium]|nr:hypothetical protein [Clostridia bacterium]
MNEQISRADAGQARPFFYENGLRRGARYDSVFFGAYAGPRATFDIRVRFDFKQKLRLSAFRKAADAALRLYPEFAVSPVVYNGRVCFKKNEASVRLAPDDGRRLYFGAEGEDGTNGFLFVFLYGEKHITLSLFHGLTDARGMISYVITVLWLYLKNLYPALGIIKPKIITSHGIRLGEKQIDGMDDLERYDPLTKFARPGEPVDLIDTDRLFRMPPEVYDPAETGCRLINLRISNKAFYEKTKALNTSFAPLLAALTAKAIGRLYDIGDRQISVITTVDARKFFDTHTLGNMAYNCPLPVEKADLELSLGELAAKLKRDMALQVTKENAERTFTNILSLCDTIDGMGDIVSVNRTLTGPGGVEALATNGTLFLTYPGRVNNNPISRALLTGVTPGMLAVERAVVVYAHREELVIQLSQKSDDMALADAFAQTLAENGLVPERDDMGRVTQNVFTFDRIEIL